MSITPSQRFRLLTLIAILALLPLACDSGSSSNGGENECDPDPCQNGGVCLELQGGGFACQCPAGFGGDTCETDIDDCSSNPCLNSGTCTDGVDSFTCSCAAGFEGTLCETETPVDDCSPDPCQNGGSCVEVQGGGFVCQCPAGYAGATCDTDIDDCSPNPCFNGGTCTDGVDSFTCQCAAGFDGDECENNIDDCSPNPCLNGGTCTDGVDSFTCQCVAGFDGDECENNIDDCSPNPCLNGGTCTDGVDSFTCQCLPGFSGTLCSCSAQVFTQDFSSMGTSVVTNLDFGSVVVTGSADLNLLNFNGLGVVGGLFNNTVDSNEWVRFDFATSATVVSYFVGSAGNQDGDGTVGDSFIEGFAIGGASLGSVPNNGSGVFDVSALFGGVPLSAFTVTADVDNLRIGSVTYTSPVCP